MIWLQFLGTAAVIVLAGLRLARYGDVLGSCMFNLLVLSFMDAIHPEPISTRAHQGHALSIGFGVCDARPRALRGLRRLSRAPLVERGSSLSLGAGGAAAPRKGLNAH